MREHRGCSLHGHGSRPLSDQCTPTQRRSRTPTMPTVTRVRPMTHEWQARACRHRRALTPTFTAFIFIFILAACNLASTPVALGYECSQCPDGRFVSQEACAAALQSNETTIVVDATSSTATITGNWAIVASPQPSSPEPPSNFLGAFYYSDDDMGKGTKVITMVVSVFAPGTYSVALLHPLSIVAASRVPVRITSDASTETTLVYVDQREQTSANFTDGVGGTLLSASLRATSYINVTVSTERTHLDNDNFFGSFVFVDGVFIQAATVDADCSPCSTICSTTQFVAAPCTSSSDRVCSNITDCSLDMGLYQKVPPTLTSDAACANVSQCDPGFFVSKEATRTTDIDCEPVTACNTTNTYEAVVATPTSNTMCRPYCHACAPNSETRYPCDDTGASGALLANALTQTLASQDNTPPLPELANTASATFDITGPWVTITQNNVQYLSDNNDNKGLVELRINVTVRPGLYKVSFSYAAMSVTASTRVPVSFTHATGNFSTRVDQSTIDPSGFHTLGTFYIDDAGASFLIENRDSSNLGIDFGSAVTFRELRLDAAKLPIICQPCTQPPTCGEGQFIGPECVCTAFSSCSSAQYEVAAPTLTTDRQCANLTTCASGEYEHTPPTPTSDRDCRPVLPGCHDLTIQTMAPTPTSDRQCESLCAQCPDGSYRTQQCELYIAADAINATTTLDIDSTHITAVGPWVRVNEQAGDFASYLTDNDENKGDVYLNASAMLDPGVYDVEIAYKAQTNAATNVPITITTPFRTISLEIDQRTIPSSGWYTLSTITADALVPITFLIENRDTHINTENFFGNEVTFAALRFVARHKQRTCSPCSECKPGFLVDQECTPTSDTTCRVGYNASALVHVSTSIGAFHVTVDNGIIPTSPENHTDVHSKLTGTLRYGFPAGLAPGGSTSVSVELDQGEGAGAMAASLSASLGYSRGRAGASSVEAQLLTGEVWPDSRRVYVAVQVRDARGSTRTSSTTVHVRLVGGATLQQEVDTSMPSGTCSTDSGTGACIASVDVPEAWVTDAAAVDASQNGGGDDGSGALNVSVEYALTAGFQDAGRVSEVLLVRPESAFDPSGSNGLLIARVPQASLKSGDEFEVSLSVQAERAINTFRTSLFVGPELELVRFEVDEDVWTGQYGVTADGRNATGSYILRDPKTASQDAQTEEQAVATVVVRVRDGAGTSAAVQPLVSVRAVYLSDIDRRPLLVGGGAEPATVIVRRGGAYGSTDGLARDGNGFVVVEPERVVGLVASAARAELVNTAVLSGSEETSALSVRAVSSWRPGQFAVVSAGSPGLACMSLNTSVLLADADCGRVRVTGAESGGSPSVGVSVEYGGQSARVWVRVWYPEEPVQVVLDRDVVRRVARWQRDAGHDASDGCVSLGTSQFQRARVSVVGRFRSGDAVSAALSLGGLLGQSQLAVVNQSVARVDPVVSGHVQGVGAGQTVVRVLSAAVSGSRVIGEAMLEAQDSYVGIVGLDVVVASAVRVSGGMSELGNDPGSSAEATVVVERDVLDFEGQRASVFVSAVFEDLTRMELGVGREVRLRTLAPGTVRVVGNGAEPGVIVVPGRAVDGSGELIEAIWQGGNANAECGVLEVVRGRGYVSVALPPADAARATVSASRLTFAGDAAETAGVATSAELTVELEYPDRVVTATQDNRTLIDLSGAMGLVSLEEGGSTGLRLVANASKAGELGAGSVAVIRVSFMHENVSATVSVTVVAGVGVRADANPYPAYSGSSGVSVRTLHRLAGTTPAVYEALVVRAYLALSNGQEIEVSTAGALAVRQESAQLFEGGALVSDVSGQAVVDISRVTGSGSGTAQNHVSVGTSSAGRAVLNGTNTSGSLVVQLRLEYASSVTSASQDLVVNVTREAAVVAALEGVSVAAGSTLRGSVGAETTVDMRAVLDSGRVLPTLFSGGQALYPGLVVFSSSDLSGASIGARSGVVRLEGNAADVVTLTATVDDGRSGGSAVRGTVGVACNLDPEVGDADIGSASGVAVGPLRVGETVTVPVRVNTGGAALGAYELAVMFDTTVLEFVSATASVNGLFDRNAQTAGRVEFGGTVSGDSVSGSALEVAELEFRVVGAGSSVLSGTVVTLSQPDVSGTAIGSGTERAFIAGRVPFEATSTRRRRSSSSGSGSGSGKQGALLGATAVDEAVEAHAEARRRMRRNTGAPQRGDTNGDGVFGVSDVRFVLTYLVEKELKFVSARGQAVLALHASKPYTYDELDADLNTERNEDDAAFLNRVNFGLLRFVTGVGVQAVSSGTACELEVSAVLLDKGDGAASGADTRVYFDLEGGSVPAGLTSGESSLGLELSTSASVFSEGRFVTLSKGSGTLSGAIVEAELVNASVGLWRVSVPVSTVRTDIGLSVIQVTRDTPEALFVFMGGRTQGSKAYTGQVSVTLGAFGGDDVAVKTPVPQGYNPLQTFDNTVDSVSCKLASGLCAVVPCPGGQVLDGVCTLSNNTYCRDYAIAAGSAVIVGDVVPQGSGAFAVVGDGAGAGGNATMPTTSEDEWLASVGQSGGVVLSLDSPVTSGDTDASGTFRYGFPAGLAPGGSTSVSVELDQGEGAGAMAASLSASLGYSRGRAGASSVEAQLLTGEVWPDSRRVYVAVQVRDARGSTRTSSTTVHVRLVGGATLQQEVDTSMPSGTCSTDSGTGACIASVDVPEAWVTDAAAVDASQNGGGDDGSGALNVSVEYALTAGFQDAGRVSEVLLVRPESAFDPSGSNGLLIARVPQASLKSGDEFEVSLSVQAERAINTFRTSLFVGPELELVRFEVDEDVWTGQYGVTADGRNATGSYILRDPKTASQDAQTEEQAVATVVVRVRDGAGTSAAVQPLVSVRAVYLSDIDRRPLLVGGGAEPATVIVRRGGAYGSTDGLARDGNGFVVVEPERVVGLVASAARAELVNTAVLSGSEETSALSVRAVSSWRPGQFAVVSAGSPGLACMSLNTSVLLADADCGRVRVTGAESGGSPSVGVSVEYGGQSARVWVRVWYPEEPVQVVLDRDVVRRVARWQRDAGHDASDGCVSLGTSQFQRARVSVVGRFRSGDAVSAALSLGGLLGQSQLAVVNQSVARVDPVVSGHVQGVGAGQTVVRVLSAAVSGSRVIGEAMLEAQDSYVGIVGLDVVVASAVRVSGGMSELGNDPGSSAEATVVVERDVLDFEGQRASVFVSAVFEDLTRMELGVGREVRLRTLARGDGAGCRQRG
ncbi:hypothetical protein PTSG_03507 [Salpingoeca rosetta]|uniref:TNFR-Cys domain-containing protein n=1 Tax=Salpingoeca rosetta (strain ATCC 50818 / BSB-021) TaxID=946362 RepID=F2U5T6_SALR5|nr:uncharacterized protein PTSG_03507 [Salpingoeca rosetta]EGD82877.1 hypothetical protein PTSG_03507 [Salpingoeca rosetta]|eukprot:XP_004995241.1 hypothetical protein PTSG_03507 [Salpingoeca rosetta]